MATSPWVVRTRRPTTYRIRRGVVSHAREVAWLTKLAATLGSKGRRVRLCTNAISTAPPPEGRMANIEWKPLPVGLWTPPAVFVEVGDLLLQAFTDDGVPTWEIRKKTEERGEWNIIAKGTADSFEAAKAAAFFEAEAAS